MISEPTMYVSGQVLILPMAIHCGMLTIHTARQQMSTARRSVNMLEQLHLNTLVDLPAILATKELNCRAILFTIMATSFGMAGYTTRSTALIHFSTNMRSTCSAGKNPET